MIRTRCAQCGRKLKAPDSLAGRKAKCPRCGAEVPIPKPVRQPADSAQESVDSPLAALVPARPSRDHEEWIDMTAMVDVVFFLLIFFMVTSLNSQQASIEMPPAAARPGAGQPSARRSVEDFESDDSFIIVRIEADNSVWIEDEQAPTPTDLVQGLRRRLAADGKDAPTRMLVLANGDAHHGAAVMVLDAGRDAGLADVRLAVEGDVLE
ncbi:MAG: biopolymer transporter ExbD [Pirellulales bacterium]|jgi:biopolymer transport protein ExbD|nr:biopolymer transporter ExbD [Pirellulales bacterium]